jgi:hypothetical protein
MVFFRYFSGDLKNAAVFDVRLAKPNDAAEAVVVAVETHKAIEDEPIRMMTTYRDIDFSTL